MNARSEGVLLIRLNAGLDGDHDRTAITPNVGSNDWLGPVSRGREVACAHTQLIASRQWYREQKTGSSDRERDRDAGLGREGPHPSEPTVMAPKHTNP